MGILQPERALSPGPNMGASGRESGFGSCVYGRCRFAFYRQMAGRAERSGMFNQLIGKE